MIGRVFPLIGGVFWPGLGTAILGSALPFGLAIEMKLSVERQIEVSVRAPHG
jgi:hypothetical protein